MINRRDRMWLGWLAVVLTSFAALETAAIRTSRFPTLSQALAGWLRAEDSKLGPTLFAAGFMVLALHVAAPRTDASRPRRGLGNRR